MEATEQEEIMATVPDASPTGNEDAMPAGAYSARLDRIKVVDKPEWKLQSETAAGKTDIDVKQWEWVFTITEEPFDGRGIHDYTNRTLHERATAHKYAVALLARPLQRGEALNLAALVGSECQLVIVQKPNKDGVARNYIDTVLPAKRRPVFGNTNGSNSDPKGFPRRWNAAVKDCMKLWPATASEKDVATEIRVQALGEHYRTVKFIDLNTDEQRKCVEHAETLAAGEDLAF